MKDDFTLADLVEVTGAKRRSIQLWADREVIQANADTVGAGTGTHRLYSRNEAIVACLIHYFAERQIAIGELKSIAVQIRNSVMMMRDIYEFAIAGGGETIFAYEGHKKDHRRSHWPADVPDWTFQYTLMTREQFAARTTSWPDVMIAVRLETCLAKLV